MTAQSPMVYQVLEPIEEWGAEAGDQIVVELDHLTPVVLTRVLPIRFGGAMVAFLRGPALQPLNEAAEVMRLPVAARSCPASPGRYLKLVR